MLVSRLLRAATAPLSRVVRQHSTSSKRRSGVAALLVLGAGVAGFAGLSAAERPVRPSKASPPAAQPEPVPSATPEKPEQQYALKLFSGTSNPQLAEAIAKELGVSLGKLTIGRFADGEINFQITENVRGADVFVVQPTCSPANETVMELLVMLDAFKRSSPRRITAVIPYYGYARQDTKLAPRVPISAKLVADLIATAGASRVVTIDLHSSQIQGFFDIPLDNLDGALVTAAYYLDKGLQNIVVVSPDAGGVKRASKFRDLLASGGERVGLVVISKQRGRQTNTVESMQLVGSVEDSDAIIIDDMIDTAGTLCKAAELVKEAGARRVFACASHGVLSAPACQRIGESVLEEVLVTDSIPLPKNQTVPPNLKQISIAPLIADTIRRIHLEQSVSMLFQVAKPRATLADRHVS